MSIRRRCLAATATALTLREYNKTRRKTDPTAPVGLAISLVGVYFGSITMLTILLDTTPGLAAYAPLAFPILSLSGVAVLALRADHRQRLAAIEAERQERRDARRVHNMDGFRGAQDTGLGGQQVAQSGAQNAVLDVVNRTRQAVRAARLDALLRAYEADPNLGATDAARLLGVHRNTVYNYTAELEQSGRISRDDGNGVKVALGPEGFAISGGALFEPEPDMFYTKCDDCYRTSPRLSNYRKCEVYSRVVGYLRPVSQWNEGKQAEFADRKTYRVPQA